MRFCGILCSSRTKECAHPGWFCPFFPPPSKTDGFFPQWILRQAPQAHILEALWILNKLSAPELHPQACGWTPCPLGRVVRVSSSWESSLPEVKGVFPPVTALGAFFFWGADSATLVLCSCIWPTPSDLGMCLLVALEDVDSAFSVLGWLSVKQTNSLSSSQLECTSSHLPNIQKPLCPILLRN